MNLKCPYCEEEIKDPDDCYEEGECYEEECPKFGKFFTFFVSYERNYDSYKADCLNGGPHEWRQKIPIELFAGKQRCKVCERERNLREITTA